MPILCKILIYQEISSEETKQRTGGQLKLKSLENILTHMQRREHEIVDYGVRDVFFFRC